MDVYLDNNATTKVSKEVFEAMIPYFNEEFGNPSSLHTKGIKIKKVLNQSRKIISDLLGVNRNEIYFTGSGTESNNWALKGLAFSNTTKSEIITTKIEHHSILHTCNFLESLGFTVHYLDVDQDGFIMIDQLSSLINDNTLVVSIIMANNEIGTIQNIKQISKICDANSTYFHIDAIQAATHTMFDLKDTGVDLASISGHKFHAPKGIGLLYVKEGTKITNLIHGGQQEYGLRSGTENIPYIVGLAKAMKIGFNQLNDYETKLNNISKSFLKDLDNANIDYKLNGPKIGKNRLPGNLNLSFRNIDGMSLSFLLNKQGVYVSTGSACDTESIDISHVIKAINIPQQYQSATLRISFSTSLTKDEIEYATKIIINTIKSEQN
ncbi:MAG: cysteine desulfurase family protein [Candidatus Izemoplasma sp.]